MPPETPQKQTTTVAGTTPSFTFGMGLSPSFKFTPSINSALSPYRLFARSKEPEDPIRKSSVFNTPKTRILDESQDLVNSKSVDIWSLANNSHSRDMSTMHTSTGDSIFLSPEDLFLKPVLETKRNGRMLSPNLLDSPRGKIAKSGPETPGDRNVKKRKVDESPCLALASRISESSSPPLSPARFKNQSSVWTPALDAVLQSCSKKFKVFKSRQHRGLKMFKATSQNKVLSRMLHAKTGAYRTPKQISSRLARLNRTNRTYSPDSDAVSPAHTPDCVRLKEVSISFVFKLDLFGTHDFAGPTEFLVSRSHFDASVLLHGETRLLQSHVAGLTDHNIGGVVPVHFVRLQLVLDASRDFQSTPTSAVQSPPSFDLESGSFLSHLKVCVPLSVSQASFITWRSQITVYKNDQVLLKSAEAVNGFKVDDDTVELYVPFLKNFWSGYLTFLRNGSGDLNDINSLFVVQELWDQEKVVLQSCMVYAFKIVENDAKTIITIFDGASGAKLDVGSGISEVDENATVLATSSPVKPSPLRYELAINTQLANQVYISPGPQTEPTFDANVLRTVNPNNHYRQHNDNLKQPKSATFATDTLHTPMSEVPYPQNLRHHSAGQIMPLATQQMHLPPGVRPPPLAPMLAPQDRAPIQFMPFQNQPTGAVPYPEFGRTDAAVPPGVQPIAFSPGYAPQVWDSVPIALNSAPASQLRFHPQLEALINPKPQLNIVFGPILEYDPLKDSKSAGRRANMGMTFHRFLNSQVMQKPPKA